MAATIPLAITLSESPLVTNELVRTLAPNGPQRTLYLIPQGDSMTVGLSGVIDEMNNDISDLTGWAFEAVIKGDISDADADAVAIAIVNDGVTLLGAAARIDFTPQELSALALSAPYYFAIKAKSPSGVTTTIQEAFIIRVPSAAQAL